MNGQLRQIDSNSPQMATGLSLPIANVRLTTLARGFGLTVWIGIIARRAVPICQGLWAGRIHGLGLLDRTEVPFVAAAIPTIVPASSCGAVPVGLLA